MTTQDHAKITCEVEALRELSTDQLREKWTEVWNEPCRSRNKGFLQKRVAWKIQANAYGGLSQRALDRAREIADETLLKIRSPSTPIVEGKTIGTIMRRKSLRPICNTNDRRLPCAGSVITRSYEGRTIAVSVLDKGFEWEGRFFRSLSAVARAVTGSHWNGFLFFGIERIERTTKKEDAA